MKKIIQIGIVLTLCLFLISIGEGRAYADVSENKGITDNYDVNWDNVWEDEGDLSEDVNLEIADFTPNNGSQTRAAVKFINLATGKSALSATSSKVTSTATTKGKKLTTVTSATTSLRVSGMGYITGKKGMAISYATAKSTASTKRLSKKNTYETRGVHTATYNGVLSEARTGHSKSY